MVSVNLDWFNRPTLGLNPGALTYGQQGMLDGIGLSNVPIGMMEDVVMPAFGTASPIVRQDVQPITRNGITTYETPGASIRFQGREGMGDIGLYPGMDYRLVDRATGKVLTTDPTEAPAMIAALNERDGKFSNWVVEQRPAGSSVDWQQSAEQAPEPPSALGTFADIGLTTLGALAAGPLGAAAGSGLSSIAQGRSLADTLLRSGLSFGVGTGLNALVPSAAGAGASIANAGGSSVSGVGGALSGKVGGVTGGAAGGAAGSTPAFTLLPGETLINVTAPAVTNSLGASLSGIGGAVAGGMPDIRYLVDPNEGGPRIVEGGTSPEMVVTGTTTTPKLPSPTLGIGSLGPGIVSGAPFNVVNLPAPPASDEIVVTAPHTGNKTLETVFGIGGLSGAAAAASAAGTPGAAATGGGGGALGTIGGIASGAAGAASILSGLGGLLGGGGSSGSGIGIGGFNPNPGLVSYQPLNRVQNAIAFDPFTYGQSAGEFRFFNDATPQFQINQPSAPAAMVAPENPNTPRLARGGPVRGIGGGQDDLIDAKLSDGEYVFSAQDVADLGDGSNEAGARKLDEMRKLIRKQAGRKNVKTIAPPQKSVSSLLKAIR